MIRNRKYFIIFILAIIVCVAFVGCSYDYTTTKPGGGTVNPPSGGNKPPENTDSSTHFVAKLVWENGTPYIPDEDVEVKVKWLSYDGFSSSNPVVVNNDGIAECTDPLDGEYYLTIEGLPSNVGYDPNIYTADNLRRTTTITIFNVIETYKRYPNKGGSSRPDDVITFRVSTPYYRFKFTEDNQVIWCRLGPLSGPSAVGKYEIESMCNIYNNDANPEFTYYNGNMQYINDTNPIGTIGSGGVSSSFTKNFFHVFDHTTSENGDYCYYFSIRCGKMNTAEYPLYVDLRIRKLETEADVGLRPKLIAGDENFYEADGTTLKDFGITSETNMIKTSGDLMNYNFEIGDDGYYHVVNSDGSLGELVYTKIIGENPVLINSVGWQQPEVSVSDYYTKLDYTFLLRGIGVAEQSSQSYQDPSTGRYPNRGNPNAYTDAEFAPVKEKGIGYFDYCSKKNIQYYPVTAELKDFLQHYCLSQYIFYDGDSDYETEYGYVSDHESMWKIFCYTVG